MHSKGGMAARYWSLLVIATAIAGLLAMHGLEAVGVQSPGGHDSTQTSTMSSGQTHSDACSPDIPHAALFTIHNPCEAHIWVPPVRAISHVARGSGLSNRNVLTAFSVLIV